MKRFCVVAILCLLGACASQRPSNMPPAARMAFPEKEYQALEKTGKSTVTGQAFLRTRGGDVKTAAGSEVILNPVTSYSMEWYEKSYLLGRALAPSDERLWNYAKKQTADASGRFTFKNVPPGEYFVTAVITWEAGTGYKGALQVQGGAVTKRIVVKAGEDNEVIVTR